MKIVVIGCVCLFLAGCVSQTSVLRPDQLACSDKGAHALAAGIAAYNSRNLTVAFGNLQAAAACGDSDAQVNLGYMFARGEGTPTDQSEALRLYRLSAAQGNGEGMNAIGYKYEFGTGVSVDTGEAVRWYCKAAALGNARALNNLAILYYEGQKVPHDVAAAYDLWQQATDRGNNNAAYALAISYLRSLNSRDRQSGTQLVVTAALQGNAAAQQLLRSNGYKGQFPPPVNEAAIMRVQPSNLPPGRGGPACQS
jgi:TPR repeat protein